MTDYFRAIFKIFYVTLTFTVKKVYMGRLNILSISQKFERNKKIKLLVQSDYKMSKSNFLVTDLRRNWYCKVEIRQWTIRTSHWAVIGPYLEGCIRIRFRRWCLGRPRAGICICLLLFFLNLPFKGLTYDYIKYFVYGSDAAQAIGSRKTLPAALIHELAAGYGQSSRIIYGPVSVQIVKARDVPYG